jgi:hypothetical protein
MKWYKGQQVFFKGLNPAVGEVQRSSDNHGWVEVKWYYGSKTYRYSKSQIEPLNGVLNYWLCKDIDYPMTNATIPKSELIAVTSKEQENE